MFKKNVHKEKESKVKLQEKWNFTAALSRTLIEFGFGKKNSQKLGRKTFELPGIEGKKEN